MRHDEELDWLRRFEVASRVKGGKVYKFVAGESFPRTTTVWLGRLIPVMAAKAPLCVDLYLSVMTA